MNAINVEFPPFGSLYHYTTQTGLLGIITSKQIWATNILYLNDSAELNYSIHLAQEDAKKFWLSLIPEEKEFLSHFLENLNIARYLYGQRGADIFVCSFSAKQNDLSQWRGYSFGENGFNIGFDFNSPLRGIVEKQGFDLVKCVYEPEVQSEIVRKFLTDMLDRFRVEKTSTGASQYFEQDLLHQFYTAFLRMAPKFKHPSFCDENEWRLVSSPMDKITLTRFHMWK